MLSNCSATGPLGRYTRRHNAILKCLRDYQISVLHSSTTLYSDLPGSIPIQTLFSSLRPDIAICSNNKIIALELTVCHESNFEAAKSRKLLKYKDLKSNLKSTFSNYQLVTETIEVSVLGFIVGVKPLKSLLKINNIPVSLLNKLTTSAIDCSRRIYCNSNILEDSDR